MSVLARFDGRTRTSGMCEWAGEIPEHWDVAPLYSRYRVQLGKMLDEKKITGDHLAPYLRNVDVQWDRVSIAGLPEMDFQPSDRRRMALREGDLLVCEGGEAGRTAIWRGELPECYYQKAIHRLRPRNRADYPRFFYYVMFAATKRGVFRAEGNPNTIDHLTAEKLRRHRFPFPPVEEQRAIADFLDLKTTQIDAFIAKKQRQIDLLHEKRQALISEAVTKGLDTTASMNDSGIPWLGNVPAHWHIEPLKHSISRIEQGWSPQCEARPADVEEWGVLKVGCVNGNSFAPEGQKALPSELDPMPAYEIRVGDILMSRGNTRELVGCASLVGNTRPRLMISDLLYRFRARITKADPEFLVLSLRSPYVRHQIEREATGTSSSMKKIGQETVRGLMIVLPPVGEQVEILAQLKPALSVIDQTVGIITRQIAKLHEYRRTLITAAVTGKIDLGEEKAVEQEKATAKPVTKANPYFRRTVFAAAIIDRLCGEPTFGHVKFQKCMYVAQHHLRVDDFEENYRRAAAGPYDNRLVRSIDSQLEKQRWFRAEKIGDRYAYRRLEKAGGHQKYFDGYFKGGSEQLDWLLDLFRPMNTDQAEIVATLYAVWNDFLIRGEEFDDDRLVEEVLTNWDETKKRFGPDRWRKAIRWMREKGLVPIGFGKPTDAPGGK